MKGLRDVLTLHVVKTALATALAYAAGRLTHSDYPVFAALAALLVVQGTVYESVTKGLERTAGVVVGVLLSSVVTGLLGLHSWSVFLVVLAGAVLGRLTRLGDTGTIQVPISALLVLTVGQAGSYPLDRVVETVLGAAVGIAVHLVLAPPLRGKEAGAELAGLARGEAEVLRTVGGGLGADGWAPAAPGWLEQSRALGSRLGTAGTAVARARTSLRLNPRGRRVRPAVEAAQRAAVTLTRVHTQTLGIVRTLADAAARGQLADQHVVRLALGGALVAVADVVQAFGEEAARPLGVGADLGTLADLEAETVPHAVAAARTAARRALVTAREQPSDDDREWTVVGAVLVDLERLLDELAGQASVSTRATTRSWTSSIFSSTRSGSTNG